MASELADVLWQLHTGYYEKREDFRAALRGAEQEQPSDPVVIGNCAVHGRYVQGCPECIEPATEPKPCKACDGTGIFGHAQCPDCNAPATEPNAYCGVHGRYVERGDGCDDCRKFPPPTTPCDRDAVLEEAKRVARAAMLNMLWSETVVKLVTDPIDALKSGGAK